jgi:hypothetical protein
MGRNGILTSGFSPSSYFRLAFFVLVYNLALLDSRHLGLRAGPGVGLAGALRLFRALRASMVGSHGAFPYKKQEHQLSSLKMMTNERETMKRSIIPTLCTTLLLAFSTGSSLAQSGSIHAVSLNMTGTATNASIRPGGCPTVVCTTNIVTINRCYTNCEPKFVCVTNAAGQVQCTNVLVCTTHCYTNTFPRITCTNEFLAPTRVELSQVVSGSINTDGCDELGSLFPTNAVFEAVLLDTLRTNDWRGTHVGSFKILSGTNVFAYGVLDGLSGGGSHRGLEPCAICNHLEGTLRGQIVQAGALHGATLRASYAGGFVNASCPSGTAPNGALSLGIEGVVILPCFQFGLGDGDDDAAFSKGLSVTTPVPVQ